MISKKYKYAIVGASKNPSKYGHKVLRDLKDAGYQVTPVNPKSDEILGIKSVKSLSDLDEMPDVVITIVQPEVTIKIVEEAKRLNINNVWMQPGSESEEALEYCHENGLSCISNACIMVQRRDPSISEE